MLPVIATVRCDGAEACKPVAPDGAVHGRDLFDDPPPARASKEIFCVLSTNNRKNTAMVRVVKQNCRIQKRVNGQFVDAEVVFDQPHDFSVSLRKVDGVTGFRITAVLYTDPATGHSEWRTLPEHCWFEVVFEGLEGKTRRNEEASAAHDEVSAEPVAQALLHTPEQKTRLRAIFRDWLARRPPPPVRTRFEELRRPFQLERTRQALRNALRKIRNGEWISVGGGGEVVEVAWEAVEEIEEDNIILEKKPGWQDNLKTKREKLFGDTCGVSPGVSRFMSVIEKYENQSHKLVGGVLPNGRFICTPDGAFNVRGLITCLPPPKRVWDNQRGIHRANQNILDGIELVQNYMYCIKAWKRMLTDCIRNKGAQRKSKRQVRLTKRIKKATAAVNEWRGYINSKIKASFGRKKIKESTPCFVRDDKGVPNNGHLYGVREGVIVGFNPETRCTAVEMKDGLRTFRKEFYLPDVHVHFTYEGAAKPVKQRTSRTGRRVAPSAPDDQPAAPPPEVIRKRRPMGDEEDDDEVAADPKRRRLIADE